MRSSLVWFLLLALFVRPVHGEDSPPKIREFDLKTIEALGRDLFRRDHLASAGSDALLEQIPAARQQPVRGWISILGEESSTVYFIQERDNIASLAYTVIFPRDGKPKAEDHVGEALPENVRKRYEARRTAFAAVPRFYTRNTNGEVLDDPAGHGFLVYVLASTDEPGKMIIGGHYRVTVSADGQKAEQVDALSRSLLVLPMHPSDTPKDAKPVASYVTHIVSDTPVETHVFASLLYGQPLFVGTMDGTVWSVADGTITKSTIKLNVPKTPATKSP